MVRSRREKKKSPSLIIEAAGVNKSCHPERGEGPCDSGSGYTLFAPRYTLFAYAPDRSRDPPAVCPPCQRRHDVAAAPDARRPHPPRTDFRPPTAPPLA